MDIKSTHFIKAPILECSPLDPNSYKMLEPKVLDRHQKHFRAMAKRVKIDEMTPAGFKPKSTFFREEANPLDRAPAVAKHPGLDSKVKSFYKVKERKFSVSRPIDTTESFIASGGPSMHFVSQREVGRQKFLSPFSAREQNEDALKQ